MVVLAGCVTVQETQPTGSRTTTVSSKQRGKGVYHKVKKGETLWRIAKAYNVAVDEIVKSNKIPDVAHIEKNQLIFIPGAEKIREISTKEDLKKNEFSWPVKGKVLSYFSQEGSYLNKGIGIQVAEGETVRASREGEVVFSDYLSGYADTVIIDHRDGYYSIYSHNSKLLVNAGQQVFKGDPIALVGKNGDIAFVHFQIRKHTRPDNPLYYLP